MREVHYRGDVVSVDHPDAALIAEVRNALPALLAVAEAAAALADDWRQGLNLYPPRERVRDLIAACDALAALNDPTREDTDRG